MSKELVVLLSKVVELHGRATEINNRARRDVDVLAELHRQLSVAFSSISELCAQPPPPPRVHTSPRILRIAEVANRVGLGRSSIWKMVADGEFPEPRRLSARAVGWVDAEINEWLSAREASRKPPPPPMRRRGPKKSALS